ncbi:hypothetical protein IWQ60_007577, partial [Tieghemiomyces parasiticus]
MISLMTSTTSGYVLPTKFLEEVSGASDYRLDSIVTGGALKMTLTQLRPTEATPYLSVKPPGVKIPTTLS